MSNKPKVPKLRFLPLCVMLSPLALTACATQPGQVQIMIPESLRAPCNRAEVGPLATVGDLGSLVIRQEAAVSLCDTRREAVVAIVDGYTAATKPRRWPWSRP